MLFTHLSFPMATYKLWLKLRIQISLFGGGITKMQPELEELPPNSSPASFLSIKHLWFFFFSPKQMMILKNKWIASHTRSLGGMVTMPQQVVRFSWRSLKSKVILSIGQLLWAVQWCRLSDLWAGQGLAMSVQNVSSNWLSLPATWDYMPTPERNQIVLT